MNNSFKHKLKWLERALYIGGAALIAVFVYIRSDSDRQREEGVQAFRDAVQTHGQVEVQLEDPESGGNVLTSVGAPDQALWGARRIDRYQESLNLQADPPVGVLSIDRLGIEVPVYDGTSDVNLNRGVGRIEGTARVDETGNLGIAGHRDGFFRGLKDIDIDDRISLQTTRGLEFYTVSSITIVDPTDVSVLADTEDKTMTLVTCYPFYFVGQAPERYIVKATAEHSLASNK